MKITNLKIAIYMPLLVSCALASQRDVMDSAIESIRGSHSYQVPKSRVKGNDTGSVSTQRTTSQQKRPPSANRSSHSKIFSDTQSLTGSVILGKTPQRKEPLLPTRSKLTTPGNLAGGSKHIALSSDMDTQSIIHEIVAKVGNFSDATSSLGHIDSHDAHFIITKLNALQALEEKNNELARLLTHHQQSTGKSHAPFTAIATSEFHHEGESVIEASCTGSIYIDDSRRNKAMSETGKAFIQNLRKKITVNSYKTPQFSCSDILTYDLHRIPGLQLMSRTVDSEPLGLFIQIGNGHCCAVEFSNFRNISAVALQAQFMYIDGNRQSLFAEEGMDLIDFLLDDINTKYFTNESDTTIESIKESLLKLIKTIFTRFAYSADSEVISHAFINKKVEKISVTTVEGEQELENEIYSLTDSSGSILQILNNSEIVTIALFGEEEQNKFYPRSKYKFRYPAPTVSVVAEAIQGNI